MNRILLIFLVTTVYGNFVVAQNDTTYFNKDWDKVITRDSAYYFRLPAELIDGNRFLVHDYYISSGKLQGVGTYMNKEATIEDGMFIYYDEDGAKSEDPYVNGKRYGLYKSYDKNGNLEAEIPYVLGKINGSARVYYAASNNLQWVKTFKGDQYDGEVIRYYKNGEMERKEIWKNGFMKHGACFTRTGEDTTFYKTQCCPEFPRGWKQYDKYIKQNRRYPEYCKTNKIKGTVKLHVYFDTTGKVYQVDYLEKVHPLLDAEAKRLMFSMPKYEQAYDLEDDKPKEFSRKYYVRFPK